MENIPNSELCIFCDMPRETHDQMICDAIRSVLRKRMEKAKS